jgi:hypothetical protein
MIRKLKQKKLKNLDVLREDLENKVVIKDNDTISQPEDQSEPKRAKKNMNLDDLNKEILLKTKIKPKRGGGGIPYITTKNLILG